MPIYRIKISIQNKNIAVISIQLFLSICISSGYSGKALLSSNLQPMLSPESTDAKLCCCPPISGQYCPQWLQRQSSAVVHQSPANVVPSGYRGKALLLSSNIRPMLFPVATEAKLCCPAISGQCCPQSLEAKLCCCPAISSQCCPPWLQRQSSAVQQYLANVVPSGYRGKALLLSINLQPMLSPVATEAKLCCCPAISGQCCPQWLQRQSSAVHQSPANVVPSGYRGKALLLSSNIWPMLSPVATEAKLCCCPAISGQCCLQWRDWLLQHGGHRHTQF